MNQKKVLFVLKMFTAMLLCVALTTPLAYGENKKTGQVNTGDLEIEFDFSTGKLETKKDGQTQVPLVIRHRKNVIFKIININRFSFNATIHGELKEHNTDVLAGILNLTKPKTEAKPHPN